MPSVSRTRISRNQPCPCGRGTKFKLCCGSNRSYALEQSAPHRHRASPPATSGPAGLDDRCDECQTKVWMDLLDLPAAHPTCQIDLPACTEVDRLRAAVRDDDPDRLADAMVPALARVDHPVHRTALLTAVGELEAAGCIDAVVLEAATEDLNSTRPSMFVLASMIASARRLKDRPPLPAPALN